MENFLALWNRPLENTEILAILGGIALLILLSIWRDARRRTANAKRFSRKHPGAALICLYFGGQPAYKGDLTCEEGIVCSPFLLSAVHHPRERKRAGFLCLSGADDCTADAAGAQGRFRRGGSIGTHFFSG